MLNDHLALSYFERVIQETRYDFNDPYMKQVSRLRHVRCASSCLVIYVSL